MNVSLRNIGLDLIKINWEFSNRKWNHKVLRDKINNYIKTYFKHNWIKKIKIRVFKYASNYSSKTLGETNEPIVNFIQA